MGGGALLVLVLVAFVPRMKRINQVNALEASKVKMRRVKEFLPQAMLSHLQRRLEWGLERHWGAIPDNFAAEREIGIENAAILLRDTLAWGGELSCAVGGSCDEGENFGDDDLQHSLAAARKKVHKDCDLTARALRATCMTPDIMGRLVSVSSSREARLAQIGAVMEAFLKQKEINLATFDTITKHHRSLETDYEGGTHSEERLQRYATAAVEMGGKKWVQSGMKWMEEQILKYFMHGGAKKHHAKQLRRRMHLSSGSAPFDAPSSSAARPPASGLRPPLRLLDIGSCYNPFTSCASASKLEVTALDLFPAKSWDECGVYACDFLDVVVGPAEEGLDFDHDELSGVRRLKRLPASGFDIATISLVLSYLPSPAQRVAMLLKARQLLVSSHRPPHYPGVLLIMEKASAIGTNHKSARFLKHWKESITACGFELVTYQLEGTGPGRFHCFAFAATPDAPMPEALLLRTKKEMETEE